MAGAWVGCARRPSFSRGCDGVLLGYLKAQAVNHVCWMLGDLDYFVFVVGNVQGRKKSTSRDEGLF